jgi:hypothetical protein
MFQELPPQGAAPSVPAADGTAKPPAARGDHGRLSADDAVDIWIARWLRIRRKDLCARYGCDPRRLYEIWWEERYKGSRERAREVFRERYPSLAERTDYGYRRIPRAAADERQASLFD